MKQIMKWWLIVGTICMMIANMYVSADLMETAFDQAKVYDYVPNVGNTRNSVGRAFLLDGYTVSISGGGIKGSVSDPIIVRVVKWFLEIVVILGIPLVIFGGVKYIMASGDEGDQKKARTWIINVIIGIVIALSSLAIVTLASSILNDARLS